MIVGFIFWFRRVVNEFYDYFGKGEVGLNLRICNGGDEKRE